MSRFFWGLLNFIIVVVLILVGVKKGADWISKHA